MQLPDLPWGKRYAKPTRSSRVVVRINGEYFILYYIILILIIL